MKSIKSWFTEWKRGGLFRCQTSKRTKKNIKWWWLKWMCQPSFSLVYFFWKKSTYRSSRWNIYVPWIKMCVTEKNSPSTEYSLDEIRSAEHAACISAAFERSKPYNIPNAICIFHDLYLIFISRNKHRLV